VYQSTDPTEPKRETIKGIVILIGFNLFLQRSFGSRAISHLPQRGGIGSVYFLALGELCTTRHKQEWDRKNCPRGSLLDTHEVHELGDRKG
jgi:hypothetical protein